jgi:hypothetical protein
VRLATLLGNIDSLSLSDNVCSSLMMAIACVIVALRARSLETVAFIFESLRVSLSKPRAWSAAALPSADKTL